LSYRWLYDTEDNNVASEINRFLRINATILRIKITKRPIYVDFREPENVNLLTNKPMNSDINIYYIATIHE